MKAVFAILLPVAFLLLLHSAPGSAEETLDASSDLTQQTSGDDDALASPSRAKRGRRFNLRMLRYNRGLHMLRLGKRADDLGNEDSDLPTPPPLPSSPESLADLDNLLGQYYYYTDSYPGIYDVDDNNGEEVDGDGDVNDDDGELYYPEEEGAYGDEDDDGFQQGDRFRRSESDAPVEFAKRQDEQNNDEFTDENKRGMSMLRLGKRQIKMLRLGKRPMSMLRLGKRPMSMLRLGKRPMNMLRLGKRPMNMLRLGKRPMNMLRLGKRPMSMLRLGKRPMNMLRLGKRPMSMLRLGKRPMSMLRLGKRPMNMLRLGKRPMNMLRLGKRPMSMLRLGKRSADESAEASVSA